MKGQDFRQLYESLGPQGTYEKIVSCLREGDLQPSDFSLQELFLGCCGERAYAVLGEKYRRRRGDVDAIELCQFGDRKTGAAFSRLEEGDDWSGDPQTILREAGEGVDLSAFSAITGQIAFNYINKGWENAEMVGDLIFQNRPTEFSGQKIPWLSNLYGPYTGDVDIHPGMDYPEGTFAPRFITTPRTLKKGCILSIPLEFLLFDRTGQAGQKGLEALGKAVRYQKEYTQLRVFMGFNPIGSMATNIASPWAYCLNGAFYSPLYQTAGTNFANAMSGVPLVDWTSINEVIYLRSKIIDPDSGRPIALGPPKDLFVMPANLMLAKRILTATSTQSVYPAYSAASVTNPGNVKLEGPNPVNWQINLLTSPIAYQLLLSAGYNPAGVAGTPSASSINAYWWMGDFKETFSYFEIFPFRAEQAVAGNIREFQNDIKLRFKVSEMGVPGIWDARNTQFMYNN